MFCLQGIQSLGMQKVCEGFLNILPFSSQRVSYMFAHKQYTFHVLGTYCVMGKHCSMSLKQSRKKLKIFTLILFFYVCGAHMYVHGCMCCASGGRQVTYIIALCFILSRHGFLTKPHGVCCFLVRLADRSANSSNPPVCPTPSAGVTYNLSHI